MRITSLEEYGLRCMVQLARHGKKEPLTIAEIAESEGLSLPYVGKLMNLLRQAGLVDSVRGRSGGYVLPKPPDEITLDAVIKALGGVLFDKEHCRRHPAGNDVCVHSEDCSIRPIWISLGDIISQTLQRSTLADLVRKEDQVGRTLRSGHRSGGSVSHESGGGFPLPITGVDGPPNGD